MKKKIKACHVKAAAKAAKAGIETALVLQDGSGPLRGELVRVCEEAAGRHALGKTVRVLQHYEADKTVSVEGLQFLKPVTLPEWQVLLVSECKKVPCKNLRQLSSLQKRAWLLSLQFSAGSAVEARAMHDNLLGKEPVQIGQSELRLWWKSVLGSGPT